MGDLRAHSGDKCARRMLAWNTGALSTDTSDPDKTCEQRPLQSPLDLRRTDRETWRQSKQLEAFEQDVVQFEGVRAVPTILLFLTLQEDQGNGGQRDGGGGRYKRLMDSVGERQGSDGMVGVVSRVVAMCTPGLSLTVFGVY